MDATFGTCALQQHVRRAANPVLTQLWNIELSGYERLPERGPAILCPNHLSFFDSALLAMTAPRAICFLGKVEYMRSWTTRYLFPAMGMIPIDRSGGAESAVALDRARAVLADGALLTIFPEGSRSRDGFLHKGRTGAARLAMSVGCPIYPVGIVGTDRIQPPGAPAPKPGGSCSLQIGDPLDPGRYARLDDHVGCRTMTDEVMYRVQAITGQPYVHRYAGEQPNAAAQEDTGGEIAVDHERELLVSAV